MNSWKKPIARHSRDRECNLCGSAFAPENRFQRICDACKAENELYRFYDAWPGLESVPDPGLIRDIA